MIITEIQRYAKSSGKNPIVTHQRLPNDVFLSNLLCIETCVANKIRILLYGIIYPAFSS